MNFWWISNDFPDCVVQGRVDDETSAFRFAPACDADAPLLVVGVHNPELWRVQFSTMWGQLGGWLCGQELLQEA